MNLIPVLPKLVANDVKTMVNAKRLLNKGVNSRDKQIDVIKREAQALVDTWLDPEFPLKLIAYYELTTNKKNKKKGMPKL